MNKKHNKTNFPFSFRVLTLQLCAYPGTWHCLHEAYLWKVSFITDYSFLPQYTGFSLKLPSCRLPLSEVSDCSKAITIQTTPSFPNSSPPYLRTGYAVGLTIKS